MTSPNPVSRSDGVWAWLKILQLPQGLSTEKMSTNGSRADVDANTMS
jgi:hypothetical protein